MDPLIPIVLVAALPVLLVSAGSIWFLLQRNAAERLAMLETDPRGSIAVPVRELILRGGFPFFAMSRNSLKPKFSIEPGGIRFRVITESYWPFSEIEQVDARKSLFGAQLVIRNGTQRSTLRVSVRDMAMAEQTLAALRG